MARNRSANRANGVKRNRSRAAGNSWGGQNMAQIGIMGPVSASRCCGGVLGADNVRSCGCPPFVDGPLVGGVMNEAEVRGMLFDPSTTCYSSRRDCGHHHDHGHHWPQLYLTCGTGYDLELEDVPEGETSLLLASVDVNRWGLRRPLVKIDFSTIIEVEDGNEVELLIALRRTCNGVGAILQTWELEFDEVENLPFAFTYCDDDVCPHGCCTYTVEIIAIEVECGEFVSELETESTAINAIVQG